MLGANPSESGGSGSHLLHDLVGDVKVRIDLLHIVVLIQNFHELQHLLSSLLLQRDRILRDEVQFGKRALDFRIAERLFDRLKIVGVGEDFKGLVCCLLYTSRCV